MKEKVFSECLVRMEMLRLSKNCISAFKEGKIWLSEGRGALYEIEDRERAIIEEFEKEHENYKVYHLIHNIYEFGEIYSLLYVSSDTNEWEEDKNDIQEGYVFAYCKNMDFDYCSEFGTIGVKQNIGGLVRVC